MAASYAEFIIKHRWWAILFSLIVVIGLGVGVKNLTFESDYRIFFESDNPQLIAFEELQDTYSKNDNVMIVLVPKDANVFSKKSIQATHWLTEKAWKTPYSIRVDSITNFQHTTAEGDDLIVADLIYDDIELTENVLQRAKNIALKEPLLIKRLVSPSAHVSGINITINLKGKEITQENAEVVSYIRGIRDEFREKFPDIELKLTGMILMNAAFPEASEYDMQNLVPYMFLMFLFVLYLWTRGLSGTITTFLIIIFSIVGALGTAGWMGIVLTPPSFSAVMIIPTMAIADSVHILMNFLQSMRRGEDKKTSMVESIRVNLQPVFLTSLTTAIGFLSMNFSDSPPFHDLGNIVAFGVGMAFFLSVVFLPAMMTVLPVRVRVDETAKKIIMVNFGEWVIKYRNVLLGIMLVFTVIMLSLVPKNELNDEFVKYFSDEIEFRRDSDFAPWL